MKQPENLKENQYISYYYQKEEEPDIMYCGIAQVRKEHYPTTYNIFSKEFWKPGTFEIVAVIVSGKYYKRVEWERVIHWHYASNEFDQAWDKLKEV